MTVAGGMERRCLGTRHVLRIGNADSKKSNAQETRKPGGGGPGFQRDAGGVRLGLYENAALLSLPCSFKTFRAWVQFRLPCAAT